MRRIRSAFIAFILVLSGLFVFIHATSADEAGLVNKDGKGTICATYITSVGCPNCAVTDPIVLTRLTARYPSLIVLEYEIYDLRVSNQLVAAKYFETYISDTSPGVPFLVFNKEQTTLGRDQVSDSEKIIDKLDSNGCPDPSGALINFDVLDITNLPGKVKIWTKDRILIPAGGKGDNALLKKLLLADNLVAALRDVKFKKITPEPVLVSGGTVEFDQAIRIDDFILQWWGDPAVSAIGSMGEAGDTDMISWSVSSVRSWISIIIVLIILFFIFRSWISKKSSRPKISK